MTVPRDADRHQVPADSDGPGAMHLLRRGAAPWAVLGTLLAVAATHLILIGNSLAGFGAALTAANRAVSDAACNTEALPAQLDELNEALMEIDGALIDLPEHSERINAYLTDVIASLNALRPFLTDTGPQRSPRPSSFATVTNPRGTTHSTGDDASTRGQDATLGAAFRQPPSAGPGACQAQDRQRR